MKSPSDRILEYALEQHFAPAPEKDLSAQIAVRWSAGESGSLDTFELEQLSEDSAPGQPKSNPAQSRRRSPYLVPILVAAGLLGVAFGVQFWPKADPSPAPSSQNPALVQVDQGPVDPTPIASPAELFLVEQKERAEYLMAEIAPTGERLIAAWSYWNRELALEQAYELRAIMKGQPEIRSLVAQNILAMASTGAEARMRNSFLLDTLVVSRDPLALHMARTLWLERPSLFFPLQIVALAEAGFFEFEREVIAQLDHGSQSSKEYEYGAEIFAIQAALNGDNRGQAILDETLEKAEKAKLESGIFVFAAIALESLGASGAWELAMDEMRETVEGMIASGMLGLASNQVDRLEAMAGYREAPEDTLWTESMGLASSGAKGSTATAWELRERLTAVTGR